MKRISLVLKVVLSIVVFTSIVYAVIAFATEITSSYINNGVHYTLMGLNFLVLIYLFYRLFNFKKTPNETKVLWFFLLVFISPSMLYYIWVTDDKKVLIENQ